MPPPSNQRSALLQYYGDALKTSSLFQRPDKIEQVTWLAAAGEMVLGEVPIPEAGCPKFETAFLLVFTAKGEMKSIAAAPIDQTDEALILNGTLIWNVDLFPDETRDASVPARVTLDQLHAELQERFTRALAFRGHLGSSPPGTPPPPLTETLAVKPTQLLDLITAGVRYALHGPDLDENLAPSPEQLLAQLQFLVVCDPPGSKYNINLIKLVDLLEATKPEQFPQLLSRVLTLAEPSNGQDIRRSPIALVEAQLGHADPAIPLNASQRLAVAASGKLGKGEIQAINGPPGTGKTSLIKSAIAHEVVSAALQIKPGNVTSFRQLAALAPLVVASSTNRTAVTNALKDLTKPLTRFRDRNDKINGAVDPIGERWLPIPSYGWFCGSAATTDAERHQWIRLDRSKKKARERWQTSVSWAAENPETEALSVLLSAPDVLTDQDLALRREAWMRLALKMVEQGRRVSAFEPSLAALQDLPTSLGKLLDLLLLNVNFQTQQLGSSTKAIESAMTVTRSMETLSLTVMNLEEEHRLFKASLTSHQARLRSLQAQLERASQLEQWSGTLMRAMEQIHQLLAIEPNWVDKLTGQAPRIREDATSRALKVMHDVVEKGHSEGWHQYQAEPLNLPVSPLGALERFIAWSQPAAHSFRAHAQSIRLEVRDPMERLTARPPAWVAAADLQKAKNEQVVLETAIAEIRKIRAQPDAIELLVKRIEALEFSGDFHAVLGNTLDATTRFYAYRYAARAWEVAWLYAHHLWLLEAESSNESVREQARKTSNAAMLQLYSMLAPCIGGTLQGLPGFLHYASGDQAVPRLMIIDEAGQCASEIGVPALALANRALVIGDIYQLTPIYTMEEAYRRALRRAGLSDQRPLLARLGLLAEDGPVDIDIPCEQAGSLMRVALARSAYRDQLGRGITLREHYRCRPRIIGFCQEIIYHGAIAPQRPEPHPPVFKPGTDRAWPSLGYVAIDGERTPDPFNGSSNNQQEAQAIRDWFVSSRERIKGLYPSSSPYKAVAIVTPYKGQARLIRDLIRAAVPAEERAQVAGMIIGTVHRLQGAQAPIVLLSLVIDQPPETTTFLDSRGPNLVNVAVSRAQDHLFVFASSAALAYSKPGGATPVARLLAYVQRAGERLFPRQIVIIEGSGKLQAVREALGPEALVLDSGGNPRKLAEDFDPLTETQPRWTGGTALATHLDEMASDLGNDLDAIYLATDDDDAGEYIAWHLQNLIRSTPDSTTSGLVGKMLRMRLRSTDPTAVREARRLAGPGVDAVRVRQRLAQEVMEKLLDRAGAASAVGLGRNALAILQELDLRASAEAGATTLHMSLMDQQGAIFKAQVYDNLYPPAPLIFSHWDQIPSIDRSKPLLYRANGTTPGLWWPRTTFQVTSSPPPRYLPLVLAEIADQLQIPPWEAMTLLEDLYLGRRLADPKGKTSA